jgi:CRP-like cAMP-binding protein
MVNQATQSTYRGGEVIYAEGDDAGAVFYIRHGRIKLTVVSSQGKEEVVAILKSGHFFGVDCSLGHAKRLTTATAITSCCIIGIEKSTVVGVLEQADLAETFISSLTGQSQYEDDLADPLSEVGKEEPEGMIPITSQEMLAEIDGTTRSHINHFMNKFRRSRLIE